MRDLTYEGIPNARHERYTLNSPWHDITPMWTSKLDSKTHEPFAGKTVNSKVLGPLVFRSLHPPSQAATGQATARRGQHDLKLNLALQTKGKSPDNSCHNLLSEGSLQLICTDEKTLVHRIQQLSPLNGLMQARGVSLRHRSGTSHLLRRPLLNG